VDGLEAARAVEGVVEITITAHPGARLVPLPEGSRSLGFIFSRAADPAAAEKALRGAHGLLAVILRAEGPSRPPAAGPRQ
jgi:hypothetical protein